MLFSFVLTATCGSADLATYIHIQVLLFPVLIILCCLFLFSEMSSRKHLSGCAKRKRKKEKDKEVKSLKGSLNNFFRPVSSSTDPLELAIVSVEEQMTENTDATNDDMNDGDNNSSQHEKLKT